MSRNPDALIPYLEEREAWTFGYGREPLTQDCARFCGGGVEAVTGFNPLDRFASQWTTARGARRVLARHGGMAAAVSEVMTPVALTLAARGDVGLTHDGALVLIEGDTVAGVTDRGLIRLPRAAVAQAWTVANV